VVLAFALCSATGIASATQPALGIGLVAGVVFVAVVMSSLIAGLVLFTAMSFLEVASVSGSAVSFMKVAGLVLFISWLIHTNRDRQERVRLLLGGQRRVLLLAAAFVSWSALSAVWAESPGAAGTATSRFLLNLLLVPIVIGAVRRREHVLWMLGAFVIGGLAAALYGFLSPEPMTARDFGRLSATNLDANGVAISLVVAVAFAAALIHAMRGRPLMQWCLRLAIVLALVGIFDTQSRSGVVALVTMLVAGVLFGGRWRPSAAKWLAVVLVAMGGYLIVTPADPNQHLTSSNTAGRSDLWRVATRMFESHPLVGVGSGNFTVASVQYVNRPGAITRADLIVDTPLPPHNVYLQVAAELGIPGLIALIALLVTAAASALRAATVFRDAGRTDLELAARCCVFAIAAYAASNFFLPNQFSKQLWLLVALGPTLLALATRDRHAQSADEGAPSHLTFAH
jgi:O-antigen ligase